MKIMRITTENEISVHDFPMGDYQEQNLVLRRLIGSRCEMIEHVMPKRLYTDFGGSHKVGEEKGSCVSMLIDEDGRYHELPVNLVGSYLYETDKHGYPIVGNILIIGEYRKGEGIGFCGLSKEQFELLYPRFDELVKKVRG